VVFFFYVVIWTRTREEGPHNLTRGRKPVEANFALDTNAVSASPKGQRPAAQRGLDFDTKQRDARSAYELFRNYRVAISQALPRNRSGAGSSWRLKPVRRGSGPSAGSGTFVTEPTKEARGSPPHPIFRTPS
jgi:hypothetical protein